MQADVLDSYRRAQDGFGAVLAAVPAANWDVRSACDGWTPRDVAGHVIWGQEQLRDWATLHQYTVTAGDGSPTSGGQQGCRRPPERPTDFQAPEEAAT
jgi:hypothetical protein